MRWVLCKLGWRGFVRMGGCWFGSDFGSSQECGYFGKMLWMTIYCVFSILIKGWKNVFSRWLLSFFTQHTQMGFPWLSLLLSVGFLFIYKFERLQTTWHKARFWLTSKVSLFFWLDKILLFIFWYSFLFFLLFSFFIVEIMHGASLILVDFQSQ